MTAPTAPAPVTPQPSKGYKPTHGGYPTPKNWPFPARQEGLRHGELVLLHGRPELRKSNFAQYMLRTTAPICGQH